MDGWMEYVWSDVLFSATLYGRGEFEESEIDQNGRVMGPTLLYDACRFGMLLHTEKLMI